MPIKELNAKIRVPGGLAEIGGTWVPSDEERTAAWEMYVELVTRSSVVELKPDEGLLREVLTSLYSLFDTTRVILRSHGPAVATAQDGGVVSFGHLAVSILNQVIRPLLATWHPELEDYESQRPSDTSRLEWERQWEKNADLRDALEEVRDSMMGYAGILGDVCDAKGLLVLTDPTGGEVT